MSWPAGTALSAAAAIAGCLTGGVYVAFSAIVMPGLRAVGPADAAAAMRRVNAAALRPPFMVLFFGGAAASVALIATELGAGQPTGRTVSRVVGAGLVLVSHGITMAVNVPLNNNLASGAPAGGDLARSWSAFAPTWGRANAARAAAAVAGSVLLAASLPVP